MTNATPTPKKAKSLVFAALLLLASIQAYGAADLFQAVRNNDLPVLRTAVADKANLDARPAAGHSADACGSVRQPAVDENPARCRS
jgi:hypothetical protein